METFLQIWGGAGYFLAKVLLVRAEFIEKNRNLCLAGWIIYLLGLPAWVILLAGRQDWIAAAIETAGVPAISLGIVMTWKQSNAPNKIIDWSRTRLIYRGYSIQKFTEWPILTEPLQMK
jgi:hypothetical protein